LEPGSAKSLRKRSELFVFPVCHCDVCRPFACMTNAAGTQKRGSLGRDPRGRPLRTEKATDDSLVAQAVLQGERDGIPAGKGDKLGCCLLGCRGFHEEYQYMRSLDGTR